MENESQGYSVRDDKTNIAVWKMSAASPAGRVSVWITDPDFLTCVGQPKSHQSPGMRAVRYGLQRQQEAGEEEVQLSERSAEECVRTSRLPAKAQREEEKTGNQR